MGTTFDPAKRAWTLREQGLDFMAAARVFEGSIYERIDDRQPYGETRVVTVGRLNGRMVAVCWTPRGEDRHVFSMRKPNAREQARYAPHLQ